MHKATWTHDVSLCWLMQNVLYGIFPVVLAGMGASYWRLRLKRQPLKALQAGFTDPSALDHLKDIYHFNTPDEVEFLSRAMRKWDMDGVPDPDTTRFGEFIIRVCMHPCCSGMSCDSCVSVLLLLYRRITPDWHCVCPTVWHGSIPCFSLHAAPVCQLPR